MEKTLEQRVVDLEKEVAELREAARPESLMKFMLQNYDLEVVSDPRVIECSNNEGISIKAISGSMKRYQESF
jgi:hypothetical protein